ncbi:putative Coiled-coil domain-containing protein [Tripterygium wilfordii]|uniref:Splicing factor YJU2 n=1 Tax=Tripterygium wilfordii TaxID=458696 RepID=A0A7J7E3I1_TRIWF|nr:putative Coiled-coil domain-containing protein [Tripterygium wilfordii]
MGERKVLNKYYPPDFDPSKLPRVRRPKNQQIKVRMMLPMSIRCNTCGNYIYKGTKFNSRKEDVVGETYLGIQIFRFYFKCTKCSAELAMKTDPQNSDYVVESGASRNFEPWRGEDEEADKEKRQRDAEEMGDAMKALENRTLDSKREMDILAALDEMKSMKSRHATVSVDAMLEALQNTAADKDKKLEEEDEELIRSIFHRPKEIIHRLPDDDDEDLFDIANGHSETSTDNLKKRKLTDGLASNPTDFSAETNVLDSSSSKDVIVHVALQFLRNFVWMGLSTGNSNVSSTDQDAKVTSKFSRVAVVKRRIVTSDGNSLPLPKLEENKQSEEDKVDGASIGLQSLFQNYESDESE